jgi:hypothetical protein
MIQRGFKKLYWIADEDRGGAQVKELKTSVAVLICWARGIELGKSNDIALKDRGLPQAKDKGMRHESCSSPYTGNLAA